MATIDKSYNNIVNTVLEKGRLQDDPNRKGVKRLNITKYNFNHDLRESFPALTTKELYWKGVVGELLWFLRGDTNIKYLVDNGINIWNKDAYNWYCKRYNTTPNNAKKDGFFILDEFISTIKNRNKKHPVLGNLGRVYGAQWRAFGNGNDFIGLDDSTVKYLTIDQLSLLLHNLKNNPLSSEHIVTFQNPMDKGLQALPPCHKGFQLMVYELTLEERAALGSWKLGQTISELHCDLQNIPKYGFDLVWEQRSCDLGLGIPFNIASYALLAHIIGSLVNMVPGMLYGDLRNIHLYDNSINAIKGQLKHSTELHPNCTLNPIEGYTKEMKNIDDWLNSKEIKDFTLNGYTSYPKVNIEMLSRS